MAVAVAPSETRRLPRRDRQRPEVAPVVGAPQVPQVLPIPVAVAVDPEEAETVATVDPVWF